MGRAPCCDKANVKKGPWSSEEDAKLKSYIEMNGTGGNWISLPQKVGLKRCGKSCRLRWLNYLRPNLKHGGFSEEEDNIICSFYITIGSRWSLIAAQLPGRTDNDIKNYWNTSLKKKLLGKPRKDNQIQIRRAPKQDPKNPEAGLALAISTGTTPARYWPEPTMPDNTAVTATKLDDMFGQFDSFYGASGLAGQITGWLSMPEAVNWSSASSLMYPPMAATDSSSYQGSIGVNGGLDFKDLWC